MAGATNGRHYDGGKRRQEYKRFGDTPKNDAEYYGDGKEQEDFFRRYSNSYELMGEISNDTVVTLDQAAFHSWTAGAFMHGQQYKDWDKMSRGTRFETQIYDEVLDRAVLKKGIEVRRLSDAQLVLGFGNKEATLSELQAMRGSMVKSRGNMSTSAASQGLGIHRSLSKTVEYVIKIPGGSKGAGMWIGDYRMGTWGNKQREFMMNRDTLFKVGSTKYDASRKIFVTELTYVGREAHNYGKVGKVDLSEYR